MHLFNAEGLTIKQTFKKLWTKIVDGTIAQDIKQGFIGGYRGYRTIMDNSNGKVPLGVRYMLKGVLTVTEMGATKGFVEGIDTIYNMSSGFLLDTVPTNIYGYVGYYSRQYTDAFFVFPQQGSSYDINNLLPIPTK